MPEVSIIIPVYNAAKYLTECLDSVLAQTLQDIEIICINDGSTDESLEIIRKYQKWDTRIVIIDQENKGVSGARNSGINTACGTYLLFLDADDRLDGNAFPDELRNKDSDLVMGNFSYLQNNQNYHVSNIPGIAKGKKVLKNYLLWQTKLRIGSYFIKSEVIYKNTIKFSEGCNYGEDWEFTTKILYFSEKVVTVNRNIMHYRINGDSVMHKVSLDRFDTFFSRKRLYDFFRERNERDLALVFQGYLLPQAIIDTGELIYQQKFIPQTVMEFLRKNNSLSFITSDNFNEFTPVDLKKKISRFHQSNFIFAAQTYCYYQINKLKSSIYKMLTN